MAAEKDGVPLSGEASQAPVPAGAVFLSYASEDAAAAERIATALRNAGIEAWFDQSELRGGDAWDRRIREQIHDCRLFVAVISAHTEARDEGYFRREWKLAVDRTHDMDERKAFLLPVVIDATSERGAHVPEKFHDLQWTRLPGGETPPAFVQRVLRLLGPDAPARAAAPAPSGSTRAPASKARLHPTWPSNALLWIISALLAIGLTYLIAEKLWFSQHLQAPAFQKAASGTSATPSNADAFNPPPHSIAVLPFVNMSGDKEQEYFSDGLSEELLNDLARINELQVAARTSAFSFKGKDTDIGTIARKLNVGTVLEGSVRRSGHKVRISAQLNNAVTGFHLWSQTYDRDLGDVLKLQTEIATAVAGALKVTLLGDAAAKIELGGTRDPAAFDAYLRAVRVYENYHDDRGLRAAVATFTESIQIDPGYALAYAARSLVTRQSLDEFPTSSSNRLGADTVRVDALKAITLAPSLAEGHLALAAWLDTFNQDMTEASREYERAATLAPGNTQVLRSFALSAAELGRAAAAITAARRAVALDPLSALTRRYLARVLFFSRHYNEAITAADQTSSLDPGDAWAAAVRGQSHYLLGELERARSSCEITLQHFALQVCRAIVYQRIGQRPEAEAALAKLQGDKFAYQYAQIFAQWGNTAKALEWLDTGIRLHDTGLKNVRSDPLLDPLRNEPHFQAIERALKFPD